jgi:folylpolyglutamate synthase
MFLTVTDFVNNQFDANEIKAMKVQHTFAEKWATIDPNAKIAVLPSIEDAIKHARAISEGPMAEGEKLQVFITGSLHLVGGALCILEGPEAL